jgi:hypothetical protein
MMIGQNDIDGEFGSDVYVVKIANRAAVQRLAEARELVGEAAEESPWSDELRRAVTCLEEVWNGLTFGLSGECHA